MALHYAVVAQSIPLPSVTGTRNERASIYCRSPAWYPSRRAVMTGSRKRFGACACRRRAGLAPRRQYQWHARPRVAPDQQLVGATHCPADWAFRASGAVLVAARRLLQLRCGTLNISVWVEDGRGLLGVCITVQQLGDNVPMHKRFLSRCARNSDKTYLQGKRGGGELE